MKIKTKLGRDGYVREYWPSGHPMFFSKGRWIKQHRRKMSDRLGRPLLPTEHVHHKNGNRRDNRLSNLVLMDRSKHCTLHSTEKWKDPEYKKRVGAKISETKKRRFQSDPDFRDAMLVLAKIGGAARGAKCGGLPIPDRTRERMSEAHKQLWDSGYRGGMSGKRHSLETIQKMRESHRRRKK